MRAVATTVGVILLAAILLVLLFDITLDVPCGTAISEACGTLTTP